MFNALKTTGTILFLTIFLICGFSNNVFSENIKIKSDSIKLQSASGSSKTSGLNVGEVKVSTSVTKDLDVGHESITLEGAEAPEHEQANIDLNGTTYTGKKNKYYEGITISRVTGSVNSSVVKRKDPKKMKQVKNLGKPEGVHAMARSVNAEVKHSDSPRMNKMQERKMKSRANMKKELKEKRVKGLNQ